ncbi:hypothetical protein JCM8547_000604 [Rhodosporidiobolus lusitaniae]
MHDPGKPVSRLPHACPKCFRVYTRTEFVRRHWQTKHAPSHYPCNHCVHSCSTFKDLLTHYETVHPFFSPPDEPEVPDPIPVPPETLDLDGKDLSPPPSLPATSPPTAAAVESVASSRSSSPQAQPAAPAQEGEYDWSFLRAPIIPHSPAASSTTGSYHSGIAYSPPLSTASSSLPSGYALAPSFSAPMQQQPYGALPASTVGAEQDPFQSLLFASGMGSSAPVVTPGSTSGVEIVALTELGLTAEAIRSFLDLSDLEHVNPSSSAASRPFQHSPEGMGVTGLPLFTPGREEMPSDILPNGTQKWEGGRGRPS